MCQRDDMTDRCWVFIQETPSVSRLNCFSCVFMNLPGQDVEQARFPAARSGHMWISVLVRQSQSLDAWECFYIRRCLGCLCVLCLAEWVQRLSFGLLIPFYSAGIMCYSNPNPIWGVWRWHGDDVTARTTGGTENHRPTHTARRNTAGSDKHAESLSGGKIHTSKESEQDFST